MCPPFGKGGWGDFPANPRSNTRGVRIQKWKYDGAMGISSSFQFRNE
jgi:hypothetical protein